MSDLRVQILALVCFCFVFDLYVKTWRIILQSLYMYCPQSTFFLFVHWRRNQNCVGLTPLHADFLHSIDRESCVAWGPFADRIWSHNCQTVGSQLNDENSLLMKWAQRDLRFCLRITLTHTHTHTPYVFCTFFFPMTKKNQQCYSPALDFYIYNRTKEL